MIASVVNNVQKINIQQLYKRPRYLTGENLPIKLHLT